MEDKYISGEKHHEMHTQIPHHQNSPIKPIVLVVAGLVIVGLSFYGGVRYEKGHLPKVTASSTSQDRSGSFGGGFGGRSGGQRPTFGQVTAVSSSSITVNDQQTGSGTTFSITSGTTITDNGQTTTASDIAVGDTVAIAADSSNTSQASQIIVNPSYGGYGGSSSSNSNGDSANPPTAD
ncbi:MAG TPA: DUF5666 domain-containing protein [Candidatus Saccharimonadales bacterium]|jgi:hypothetical protein|nr:DUF5666 domain-containing protein [Candidatus Saccharimonadales bacterium]